MHMFGNMGRGSEGVCLLIPLERLVVVVQVAEEDLQQELGQQLFVLG